MLDRLLSLPDGFRTIPERNDNGVKQLGLFAKEERKRKDIHFINWRKKQDTHKYPSRENGYFF